MLKLIVIIIAIAIILQVIKAILNTGKGAFLFLVIPICLFMINFTIAWENYWSGMPIPNPVQPDGFLYAILARFCGGIIDSLFGTYFFEPVFGWILGALFYSALFWGLQNLFINHFLFYVPFEKGIIFFVVWLVFFTAFYYFRAFDSIFVFRWFSMPYEADINIKIYYWIGIALSIYEYVREGLNQ